MLVHEREPSLDDWVETPNTYQVAARWPAPRHGAAAATACIWSAATTPGCSRSIGDSHR